MQARELTEGDIEKMWDQSQQREQEVEEEKRILASLTEIQGEMDKLSFHMKITRDVLTDPKAQRDILNGIQKDIEQKVNEVARISTEHPKVYRKFLIDQLITKSKEALEKHNPKLIAAALNWGLDRVIEMGFGFIAHPEEAEEIYAQMQAREKPSYHYIYFSGRTVIFPQFKTNKVVQAVYYPLSDLRRKLAEIKKARSATSEQNETGPKING